MDKLAKIHTLRFAFILIVLILIFSYYYVKNKHTMISTPHNHQKTNTLPSMNTLIKNTSSGMIRGAIMGFLLYGVEGAVTSSIVLGIVNSYMTTIDSYL